MVCPSCRTPNPDNLNVCKRCGTLLDLNDMTLPVMDTGPIPAPGHDPNATQAMGTGPGTAWSQPSASAVLGEYSSASLEPGTVLAGRYEIVQLLGEGGMGAVYRAHDRELDRVVALKVIRPELARNAAVLQRFKQELILARQVTHRNIIRIFDLGQSEGLRFITMEFIEGEDLSHILARRGKLPAAEAAAIITQVTRGLEAAHTEGVVHRDLKPQNIMIDASGKASVMDFGIARSMDASSMTRTGALMGTPTYMSPEQAQGHKADARSDLYTLGIIFYELLTGKPPFQADNPMATLVKRIQEKPVPPKQLDPAIPKPVNDVVLKMLATKPEDRFQSTTELLLDLDALETHRTGRTGSLSPIAAADRPIPLKYVAAAMLVVIGLGVYFFTRRLGPGTPAGPTRTVSVLVSDFRNATQEAVFDGTLEPTFSLALEGASFISTYSRGDARKAAQRIQPGAAQLDEKMAQLVATSEGINYVITGAIEGSGGQYTIRARILDPATGKSVVEKNATAGSKQDVLNAAGKLAAPIRKALGDSNPERATETFSSSSLEAAQAYARGQDFQWAQNYEEAIKSYQQALASDPEMGRAYAGLAASHANSFHLDEADRFYKLALSKTGRMTEREQYRTRGAYYLFTRNYEKAIDEFTALTRQFPADDAGRINLATALFYSRNFEGARQESQSAIAISPNNVLYRSNAALFAMYAGQFEDAIKTAAVAIKLNPGSTSPYVATALSEFALGRLSDAETTYKKLAATGARGASRAASGLADIALYEGRVTDAVAILEAGIQSDLAGSPKSSAAASKFAALAGARHNRAQAIDAAAKALAINETAGFAFGAARVLIEAGQETRAQEVARKMGAELAPELRAWSKLIEGEVQLRHGKSQAAIDLFQEAQKLADTWIGRLDLGRAYLEAGHFPEAASEFDACEKRKGEATSVFLDDVPSFRYYPQIYYYRAQVQRGLKSPDAPTLFQNFLSIKAKAEPGDPMVEDAHKRINP